MPLYTRVRIKTCYDILQLPGAITRRFSFLINSCHAIRQERHRRAVRLRDTPTRLKYRLCRSTVFSGVNLDGDENFNKVIIYVSFPGPFPMPQAYSYPADRQLYKIRDGGRDYYRRIDGARLARSTRLRAWSSAPARWWRATRIDGRDRRAAREFARS
jgi:hypothetical protein